MHNIQVTRDTSLNNARSESCIAINPKDPRKIVAGSKKFKDTTRYDFTIATAYSTDAGKTWHDSADLSITGWDGITDPALTWDSAGNVFLMGLAFTNPPRLDYVGMVIYKSSDGGKTWGAPKLIHTSSSDDKQWIAADNNLASTYYGRVYAVWDNGPNLCFARTLDHGGTWIGIGNQPPGSILVKDCFAPEVNVASDGTIYVVYLGNTGKGLIQVQMIASTDGGDSFQMVIPPATDIKIVGSSLPGGKFRVYTLPTACAGLGQTVVVAWADSREGVSRIYYALSNDGGASWTTGPSGQPLITDTLPADQHHFHPQIVSDPYGVIGCAFYEFGPKPNTKRIDVILAFSFDGGGTFSNYFKVTDHPWDPSIDAPLAHANPGVTFIGDYFGLDASSTGFYPLWTDTRTGIQELWTDIVPSQVVLKPSTVYGQVSQILAGIIQDAGGVEIVGGHVTRLPPWGPPDPALDILLGVASYRIATLVSSREGVGLQRAALNMIARVAEQEIQKLKGRR